MSEIKTQSISKSEGPWFVVHMTKRWRKTKMLRGRKPTIVYHNLPQAYAEAHRLASLKEEEDFGVFECIGYATSRQ